MTRALGLVFGLLAGAPSIIGAERAHNPLPPTAPVEARAQSAPQDRSLLIESFQALLEVEGDGTLAVLESIRVRFTGSWNGIYRLVPIEYRLPEGSHRIDLDVRSVRDASGMDLRHQTRREGPYLRIQVWVPGAQDATHTVNLRYRVRNALRHFETHDELYWNATGDRWEMPIRNAFAQVRLPADATGLRATAFTGAHGSTAQDATWTELEDGFAFETTTGLDFREGLTVVVGWDRGVVQRPTALGRSIAFLVRNWFLLIPLLSLGGMYRVWDRKGRDPERKAVTPRYEPPEGMTPAEVGTLVDHSPDMRDITASVVDLAVRGYLRIEEREEKGLAKLFGGTDYTFVRVRPSESWKELQDHERLVLEGIFGTPPLERQQLSELKNEFYKRIGEIKSALFLRLQWLGCYRQRPDRVGRAWVGGGLALGIGMAMLGALLSARGMVDAGPFFLASLLTALPVMGFGLVMPARTVEGARRFEAILGFEEFLERVESDRFRRMITSPEMFEKYLPYAMALGVEARWARAFEDLYDQPPDWYVGSNPSGFRPTVFVSHLNGMATQAASAMTSAPRSSGGSGFGGGGGGGGFSGGGFGGGGGGGF